MSTCYSKFFLIIVVILHGGMCFAQEDIVIKGNFKNDNNNAVLNLIGYAPNQHVIATAQVVNGSAALHLPADTKQGMYRIYYTYQNNNKAIDVIINGDKKLAFTLDIADETSIAHFETSTENNLWQQYKKNTAQVISKISVLNQFITFYPGHTDNIYKDAKKALTIAKRTLQTINESFIKANNGTIAALVAKNMPNRFPPAGQSPLQQQQELHTNFWDAINTTTVALINTPLYNDLLLEYLTLSLQLAAQHNITDNVAVLKQGIDNIMAEFNDNDEVRQYVIKYLTGLFRESAQDKVVQYIDVTYGIEQQCSNENDGLFEKRIESYKYINPGLPAPDIKLGQTSLYNISANYIIVAFWAGWCPHCSQEMPVLNELLSNYPDTVTVAISLDENPETFETASGKLNNMLHFCDFKKWDGEAAVKYYIDSTPTFILMDGNHTIIDKFPDVQSLSGQLSKLEHS